jgi:tRNA (cytosine34-C5)-methyltransferase
MVPVTVLAIESHHRVLDMCAAPGSKTRQALDAMLTHHWLHDTSYKHNNKSKKYIATGSTTSSDAIDGFIVANDCDPKRAYVLSHQSKALAAHTQRLMIICHKAQKLPTAVSTHDDSDAQQGFDRIICDVPCSGDGTIRKAPEVWQRWHPQFGLELHRLQLQIAMRGAALLRVGGLMCYSTCSFNPIENEAVVAEILARYGTDSIRLCCTAHVGATN